MTGMIFIPVGIVPLKETILTLLGANITVVSKEVFSINQNSIANG
jgi:hypothetical protein